MKPENLHLLIQKYLDDSATAEEREVLYNWYRSQDHSQVEWLSDNISEEEDVRARILSNIDTHIGAKDTLEFKRRKWFKILAAAAAVLIITSSGLYFLRSGQASSHLAALSFKNDIAPGKNQAVLKLSDGSQVLLNDVESGQLASQGGINIRKTAGGQLVYDLSSVAHKSSANTAAYNTIVTPSGGQYQVILPDGTKVWLNAVSSIRFPVYFSGGERNVETTGEVYFEVAKNRSMPFKVHSGQQVVEVLGTHFNVNTYNDDQKSRTTLLEGSIRIKPTWSTSPSILKPGQQAILGNTGNSKTINISDADLDESIAWKNNLFVFNNTKIEQVMLQLKRWYTIELVYSGDQPDLLFTGVIPRSKNLSSILKVLESTGGIKFGIEGRKVIIQKSTN